jgi:hypothetical protein
VDSLLFASSILRLPFHPTSSVGITQYHTSKSRKGEELEFYKSEIASRNGNHEKISLEIKENQEVIRSAERSPKWRKDKPQLSDTNKNKVKWD